MGKKRESGKHSSRPLSTAVVHALSSRLFGRMRQSFFHLTLHYVEKTRCWLVLKSPALQFREMYKECMLFFRKAPAQTEAITSCSPVSPAALIRCTNAPTTAQPGRTPASLTRMTRPSGSTTTSPWWPPTRWEAPSPTPWI